MTQRISKRCIFCGGTGMSKEHFWPQWAAARVSNAQSKSYVSELHTSTGFPRMPVHPPRQRKRNGDLSTMKLRVVCCSCNNGWMSRAEEDAKPRLLTLMSGADCTLSSQAQQSVAAWVAMKVIVAEHDQPETAMTPLVDRQALRDAATPPDYFVIRAGMHTLAAPAAYLRHSQTFVFASHATTPPPVPDMQGMNRNVQTVTFTFGQLLMHVFAARVCGLKPEEMLRFSDRALPQLWPPRSEAFCWPPKRRVRREEVPHLLNGLDRLVSEQRVKWAPL